MTSSCVFHFYTFQTILDIFVKKTLFMIPRLSDIYAMCVTPAPCLSLQLMTYTIYAVRHMGCIWLRNLMYIYIYTYIYICTDTIEMTRHVTELTPRMDHNTWPSLHHTGITVPATDLGTSEVTRYRSAVSSCNEGSVYLQLAIWIRDTVFAYILPPRMFLSTGTLFKQPLKICYHRHFFIYFHEC